MPTTYQQIISCQQLHDLLISNFCEHNSKPQSKVILLDASLPPVGNMDPPLKQWPDCIIQTAKRFDLNEHFSDLSSSLPHTMPSAEQFQQKSQVLGIFDECQIVVYDDKGIFSAARAWYMFKSMGHKNVAVLDGGLPAWIASGFPVSSFKGEPIEKSLPFSVIFSSKYFCDRHDVQEQLLSKEHLIVDARAAMRFAGKSAEPRKGLRKGHIPTSVNLPFSDLLYKGAFLPEKRLKEKFEQINTQEKPMIMSCGSGVTACVLALAAEICGFKNVQVYDGSWSEWGANPQLPLSTDD